VSTLQATSWPQFQSFSIKEKIRYLSDSDGRIQSLLFTQQLTKELIGHLVRVAELIRTGDDRFRAQLRRVLSAKACALYFPQVSTRTFTSFSLAAQTVGMMVEEIRDPELSAMYKGESELDTLLTLSSLADALVIRQMDAALAEQLAYELLRRKMTTRIVNGGSGPDQHPTQALIEIYTLLAHWGGLPEDRRVVIGFVGDLKRSRTARSLSYLLALYPQVTQVFIAPDELQMGSDIKAYLTQRSIEYQSSSNLQQWLPELDGLYLMRIQDEYSSTSESLRKEYERYHLTVAGVGSMKESACVLHPLPRRAEIPIEVDHDPRAKYWEAVARGKFIRTALLLHLFGRDDIDKLKEGEYV
jgi:aspartate carbamoyltransferase catalytic subunit